MILFLFLYLQPIVCKLDLKNDFFDNSKLYFPIIFQTPSCYLGNLCSCQIIGLVNARILGSISVLMQAVLMQAVLMQAVTVLKGDERAINGEMIVRENLPVI